MLFTFLSVTGRTPTAAGCLLSGSSLHFQKAMNDSLVDCFKYSNRMHTLFVNSMKLGVTILLTKYFRVLCLRPLSMKRRWGQYLTPPEITRFMVEAGFHALTPEARGRLLNPNLPKDAGVILDPSCGVGSFLAETIRFAHGAMRHSYKTPEVNRWLGRFVGQHVVGIDKSDRMLRLAMINLGLFGAKAANLKLANSLAKRGVESDFCSSLEGKVELILTNPPFGASFSGDDLEGFVMGHGRARAESEVLFLERYVDWLMPGGVVASVVPDSILVNRNAFADLRRWLFDRCSVDAVFSLPPVTFGATGYTD